MSLSKSEWFSGKRAGCIGMTNGSYQATISNKQDGKRTSYSKCFSESVYGSMEDAHEAAEEWLTNESLSNNLTKNRIRIVEPINEEAYLEVQLQNGLIMKCDPEDIEHVENSIWTGYKGKGKKTFYARRRESKKLNQSYIMFHNLICPQYLQVDHINRDGLDNRKSNLREGVILNPKNKGIQINNRSGVSGVYFEPGTKARWIAQIGNNGQRMKRCFAIKTYGEEKAFKLAVKTRQDWEKQLEYGNAQTASPEKITGVMYTDCDKPYWRAQYRNGPVRLSKKFSVNLYGYEEARQMAIDMRKQWEKNFLV